MSSHKLVLAGSGLAIYVFIQDTPEVEEEGCVISGGKKRQVGKKRGISVFSMFKNNSFKL